MRSLIFKLSVLFIVLSPSAGHAGSSFIPPIFVPPFEIHAWETATTAFHVNIPGEDGLWDLAFEEAMNRWNDETNFTFAIIRGDFADPCSNPNFNPEANGVKFAPDNCGVAFGDATLAIATTWSIQDGLRHHTITQSGIVFNSNVMWDVYGGPLRESEDFRRIAVHELGHTIGLEHTDYVTSIMYPYSSDVESPSNYDIQAVDYLYPHEVPPVSIADFSADPTGGNVPLRVFFTDRSQGSISSWYWSFGDGSHSSEQNPAHTYDLAGAYTVSLTVSGPSGGDTRTKQNFIVACSGLPYLSGYDKIQWGCRGEDTFYCVDILDSEGNMLYRAPACGENLHSFSPATLALPPGSYRWQIWSEEGLGGEGFEGEFSLSGNETEHLSTYDLIQWGNRGGDTFYCLDICDENWNVYDGLRALYCGEGFHSWSPKQYLNNVIGIPDPSGLRFRWRVWSPGGYGGAGFEGEVVVP